MYVQRLLFSIFACDSYADRECFFDWDSLPCRLVSERVYLSAIGVPDEVDKPSMGDFERVNVQFTGVGLHCFEGTVIDCFRRSNQL